MTKLYLTVDNCFAGKRWVTPESWAKILSEIGIRHVEASADVELDPLHMDPTYLKRWEQQMRRAGSETGVRVANFFSGHGTYATTGLLHPDEGVRRRIREQWIGAAARRAGRFGAGLGFFMHAVPQPDLDSPEAYALRREELLDELALVAQLGASIPELRNISLEQMYSPQQPPWRIEESLQLMAEVFRRSGGNPLYIALDVGHGGPQRRFFKPAAEAVEKAVESIRAGNYSTNDSLWAGSPALHHRLTLLAEDKGKPSREVVGEYLTLLEGHDYLFASEEDADPYAWIRRVGPYAPIIHLQQSDGIHSRHLPFTEETAENGGIEPKKVVEELAKGIAEATGSGDFRGGYDSPASQSDSEGGSTGDLPEPVEEIYLTLELFTPTAAYPSKAIRDLAESVEQWRAVIPKDGIEATSFL